MIRQNVSFVLLSNQNVWLDDKTKCVCVGMIVELHFYDVQIRVIAFFFVLKSK